MNYIVLDLEWNQPLGEVHDKLKFEIIEIGAVKLDENFQIISRFESFVKPTVYEKMNPFIKSITRISMSLLTLAPEFQKVIHDFANWCGEDCVFATYGSQDLFELQSNMEFYGINPENLGFHFKYPLQYIDVQKVYAFLHTYHMDRGERLSSLEDAMVSMKLSTEKEFHRAIQDAEYTAILMQELVKECPMIFQKYFSIDYYQIPENTSQEREVKLKAGIYYPERKKLEEYSILEFVSAGFSSKEELLVRRNLRTLRCAVCGKRCRKKINWFSDNNRQVCVAACKFHGYMEGTINFRTTSYTHQHYAIRKVWGITSKDYDRIVDRIKLIKEKRRQKRRRLKEKS